MTSKAVVFTHFGHLTHDDFVKNQNALFRRYKSVIEGYLACGETVALVYTYVDWAVQQHIRQHVPLTTEPRITAKTRLTLPGQLLAEELDLKGLLKMAEAEARQIAGLSRSDPPRFEFVGTVELIDLLNKLGEIDPELMSFLCGPRGQFTYDSPKFVEAVIRMAYGHTAYLARYPILRLDEDVEPNTDSIARLLQEYEKQVVTKAYYVFSGAYGAKNGSYDPVNDHAVRVHWFPPANREVIRSFLADFDELGATQFFDSAPYYSRALRDVLGAERQRSRPSRSSPQLISGAGLIMSSKAVTLLPPFMNFTNLTTWVDDHLKRRLHEALEDLSPDDTECVAEATFRQDRDVPSEAWTRTYYLDRLVRGCLFRRLISDLEGAPTAYASLVHDIVRYRVTGITDGVIHYRIGGARRPIKGLREEMEKWAHGRYEEVRRCWLSAEFAGSTSFDWMQSQDVGHAAEAAKAAIDDALGYLDLLLTWPIFVRAVDRLSFAGNWWLFEGP